jgi:small-conductance mechanosensitive channel
VILLFLLPSISFSQSVEDSIQKVPRAIKNTEIANYRNNTKLLIEESESLLQNLKRLQRIKSEVISGDSIFISEVVILKDSLSSFNISQLDRVENQIREYNTQLNSQEIIISEWRRETNDRQEQISFDLETWTLTKDSLVIIQSDIKKMDSTQLNILERVNGQVARNLERLTQSQIKFNLWNDELIETENALTAAQGEVNDVYSVLKSARRVVLSNIWIPEYPPIWSIQKDNYATYKSKFKTIMDSRVRRLNEYFDSNSDFYYSVLFSFIFILSIIIFLRYKSRKDISVHTSVAYDIYVLVKYPILSALIIISFIILIFFTIPFELKILILSISIIPFSILIWQLNAKKKILTVVFFIFYSLVFISIPFLSDYPFLLRYTLLFINGLSLFLLLLLKNNSDLIEEENSYWLGTLPFLISSFIFLSVLAIIGNVIGNVQLTVNLTTTILGTFLAFAIIKESIKLVHSFLYLFITHALIGYSNIIKDDSKMVLDGLHRLLKFAGYTLWLYVILGSLKIRGVLAEYFLIFINKPLRVGELSISLGNVIAFFLIFQVSVWISQFIRYVLDKEVYPRMFIDMGVASTFSIMIRYTLIVIGFALALAGAGLEYSKIAIGMGALGIGIGFGLQNIVNNFMSGIILAIERPIKIGDIVKVGELEGEVKDIGLRACQIKTWDGSDVIVPNGSLISEKLINWTLNDRKRRLQIELKLDPKTDISFAIQVILDTADKVPELLKTPKPSVNYEGIKDGISALNVYGWINNYSESFSIGTSFRITLYQALETNGVKLVNPILDVNVNENRSKLDHTF